MKIIIALATLVAVALAAPPQQDSRNAVITKYENDNIGIGGYKFEFQTSDGVSRSETAEVKNQGTENESLVIRGVISWVDLDGTPYSIEFVADEDGYRPVGAHIPK